VSLEQDGLWSTLVQKRMCNQCFIMLESLGNHAMVIPFDTIGSRYLHIHDQADWADYFQTMPLPPDPISYSWDTQCESYVGYATITNIYINHILF
jgi:hypothetical protein